MTLEQQVIEKLRDLSPEKQCEVLHFVETLKQNGEPKPALKSLRGIWKDFGIDITEDDTAQARREMWGNFPRDVE